jgi:hypothetical protein
MDVKVVLAAGKADLSALGALRQYLQENTESLGIALRTESGAVVRSETGR